MTSNSKLLTVRKHIKQQKIKKYFPKIKGRKRRL